MTDRYLVRMGHRRLWLHEATDSVVVWRGRIDGLRVERTYAEKLAEWLRRRGYADAVAEWEGADV